jgi:hypothetical protein
LRLKNGGIQAAVNDTTEKTAPKGAIDQIGKALSCIVQAFAEADENAKIFMAKWDIKDGFWRMDCVEGEEWNFAYVLPQEEGKLTKLVVPTLPQMGWVESPPYFCAATETSRDVAMDYTKTPINSLPPHKFVKYTTGDPEYEALPELQKGNNEYMYMLEVYVDNFMSLIIPVSLEQIRHVATVVMTSINDVFLPDDTNNDDPILEKKLKQG